MRRKEYQWQLPESIEARLGQGSYGRQRAIFEDDHLLIILHEPPKPDSSARECTLFLRKPDGKYYCNGLESGESRLRQLLISYQKLFEQYEKQYDKSASATDLFQVTEDVLPLARATTNLHAAMQSARSYIDGDTFLIGMRDEAYEISRNFDLLVGDVKLALDHRIARNAEEQSAKSDEIARAQHKLNVMAAVTFPLMAIATLLGMNLAHGFEAFSPVLFWSVVGSATIVGWLVKSWVTK